MDHRFSASYQTEGHIYAEYLLENHPRGKIAVLYQDDAFGKDYLKGLKDGLSGKIPVVAEATYKVTDTSIDAQIAKLKASGADVFVDIVTPKFAALAIKRTADIGWKPVHIISSVSRSLSAVLPPAALPAAEGVLSTGYTVEGDDPAVASDPAYREFNAFLERYVSNAAKANSLTIYGYVIARTMVEVLKRSGGDLSRENVMRQAASLKGLEIPMLLPGVNINTSPSDHAPLEQMQVMRFTGGRWERVGPVRSGIDAGSVSESFKTIFRYGTAKRDLATQMNANTVSMVTGSFGSTYTQIGADLASVLDDGTNLRVLPVMGRGSVQAVADILLLKGVDAGIVRKDTLAYLERKDFANDIRNQFVYVAKLFNEEMHVLAPRSIASMKDLDGKTVVVDLPDSSTFVTAINVFERLQIRPHLLYVEPRLALEMLRKGEVDAIVTIEGKPLPWLNQLTDRNLHLVPVEYAKPLREEYLPSKITAADYPNLVPEGGHVDTIAAEAVLASYNWAPNTDRYRRLSLLVEFAVHPDRAIAAAAVPSQVEGARAYGRRWRAGPASRRRRNGSTAICRQPPRWRRPRAPHPRLKPGRGTTMSCIANFWSGAPGARRPACQARRRQSRPPRKLDVGRLPLDRGVLRLGPAAGPPGAPDQRRQRHGETKGAESAGQRNAAVDGEITRQREIGLRLAAVAQRILLAMALDGVPYVVGIDLQPEHVPDLDLGFKVTAVFRALQLGQNAGPKLRRERDPALRIGVRLPGPNANGAAMAATIASPRAVFQNFIPTPCVWLLSCRQRSAGLRKIVYSLAPEQRGVPRANNQNCSEESFMSALPLSGIKILDLTRVLAGPLSAQMLADLGAEVIKIERPGGGDDARAFGPPYLKDPDGKENNNNSFYLCANRNKKSVTVNIATEEGQDIIRELAKSCDVMMENYKVGDLKRYRLDYESIKAINPAIIYCSVTGFGQTGPYAPRAGYDAILQAMGGLMSVTGHLDGEPGDGPMKVGPSIVDYMTGMNSSIGILAALYHRKANGGAGQHVDVCLFDTVIASLSHYAQIFLVNGQTPPRRGTWGNGGMPAGVFRCTDGELMLVVGNDGQFARTCAVLGQPELATDPNFIKNNDRVVHGKEIMAIFAGLF